MRPDGSHLDEAGSAQLWRTWLTEEILRIGVLSVPAEGSG